MTRPEPGATDTAERLAAMGLAPVRCPLLLIRPLPAKLPPAGGIAAVLLTSGNAVPGLPAAYHAIPLLAVGNATAERARQSGYRDVASADGDAGALAGLVRRRLDPAGKPLLLATGRGQGGKLAASLRQGGFRVMRRVVYAAAPAPAFAPEAAAELAAGRVSAALFFSAETARCFVRLARRAGLARSLEGVMAVAIGPSAGVALQALPWRRVRVAARPNQDEMLKLLR